jgi:hypothetical protein
MGVGGDKPCARAFLYHEKKTELADNSLPVVLGSGYLVHLLADPKD